MVQEPSCFLTQAVSGPQRGKREWGKRDVLGKAWWEENPTIAELLCHVPGPEGTLRTERQERKGSEARSVGSRNMTVQQRTGVPSPVIPREAACWQGWSTHVFLILTQQTQSALHICGTWHLWIQPDVGWKYWKNRTTHVQTFFLSPFPKPHRVTTISVVSTL
jgi:hypothetical protein